MPDTEIEEDIAVIDRELSSASAQYALLTERIKFLKDQRVRLTFNGPLKDASIKERYEFWLNCAAKIDSEWLQSVDDETKSIPDLISILFHKEYVNKYEHVFPKSLAEFLLDFEKYADTYKHFTRSAYGEPYTSPVEEERPITKEMIDAWRQIIMDKNLGTFIVKW